MKRPSLTRQLLFGIGIPFVLVIVLAGAITYFTSQDEISEVYDSQIITSAQQLWVLTRNDDDLKDLSITGKDSHLSPTDQDALEDYGRWRSFQVWRNGYLVMQSDNGPKTPGPGTLPGFKMVRADGQAWRVFTFVVPKDGIVVQVGEMLRAREVISRRIVMGVILPLCLALPLVLLAIWLGIRWGLRDLRHFATVVHARSPNDLSRVGSEATPAEIAPVAEAIDQLLAKLERSLAQERLFTDNAAHELRTPLAALGLQAEVIRNARTAREREPMLNEMSKGVQRVSRLLDQLLTLARVSHTAVDLTPVNLYQAAGDAIRDAYPKAQAKMIDLSLDGNEIAVITSNRALLSILIGNILDNAIKYSPVGSAVEVAIVAQGEIITLIVRDHGPGIPEAERDKVFARFYRLKGRVESGSGLGLSIVRSLSELLGGEVTLFTPDDNLGLGVTVRFNG